MNRPVIVCFTGFLGGILLGKLFPGILITIYPLLWVISIAIILVLIVYKKSLTPYPKLLLWTVLALLIGFGRFQEERQRRQSEINLIHSLDQTQTIVVTGRVIDNPILSSHRQTYLIDKVMLNTGKTSIPLNSYIQILINSPGNNYILLNGSNIQIEGYLKLPGSLRNPGAFDYQQYSFNRNIAATMSCQTTQLQIIPTKEDLLTQIANGWRSYCSLIRYHLAQTNKQLLRPPYDALANGICLGIQSEIPPDIQDIFYQGGIYHLLVVSGGNIMLVAALGFIILKMLRFKRRYAALINIPLVLAYSMIVGMNPPVFRAMVMSLLFLGGRTLPRDTDGLHTLVLSGYILLFLNPLSLWDSSFQLSFMAVFGLLALSPLLKPLMKRHAPPNYFKDTIITCFAVMITTFPLLACYFNYLSLVSLISNIIAAPMVYFSLPLTLFSGLFVNIIPSLANWLAAANQLSLMILTYSVGLLTKLPYASVMVPSIPGWMIMGYYGLLLFFLEAFDPLVDFPDYRKRKYWLYLTLTFCIIVLIYWEYPGSSNTLTVTFLDVGEGDSMVLQFPNHKTVLVDGGKGAPFDKGKSVILPFLKQAGIRKLDMVIATHPDDDHYGGILSVIQQIPAGELLLTTDTTHLPQAYQSLINYAVASHIPINYVHTGQSFSGFEPCQFYILNPPLSSEDNNLKSSNDHSVVTYIAYQEISFLLTGDLSEKGEMELIHQYPGIHTTVLKAGHHGAYTSTSQSFLDTITPRFAVIQSGPNLYGHPDPMTLERLNASHVKTYRTDQSGAVIATTDGTSLNWQTVIEP